MKILFLTNYFNDHLKEFCNELFNIYGQDFMFFETEKNDAHYEKSRMASPKPSYVKRFLIEDLSIVNNAEVVIFGSAPYELINERIELDNKITFLYQERPLKNRFAVVKYPYRFFKWRKRYAHKKNCYVLCASYYTSKDYKKFGLFKHKCFRFGYFPNRFIGNVSSNTRSLDSVFVARLVQLKHPEVFIRLCKNAVKRNPYFSAMVVGDGPLYNSMKVLIKKKGIEKNVCMSGFKDNASVLEIMKKSKSIVFCSDSREGWGAVINESMSCGCVPFISERVGSAGFLIKDGVNGFKYNSFKELDSKFKIFFSHNLVKRISYESKNTIESEWNGIVAARRFAEFIENNDNIKKYNTGPMSLIL